MPTRPSARLFAITAMLLASCSSLEAQQGSRHERKGFWLAAGGGSATNDLDCTGCQFTGPDDGWRGGDGSGAVFGAGGAISQSLLVGVDFNPSGTHGDGREAFLMLLLAVAQYYPLAAEGLHLKAGLGVASVVLSGRGGGAENAGPALQIGIGYDVRSRRLRSFALTPYASYTATRLREGVVRTSGNATSVTGLQNRRIVQFGLALRWY